MRTVDYTDFFATVTVPEWEHSVFHETDCSYLAGYYYTPVDKGDGRIAVWFHDNPKYRSQFWTDTYVIYDSIGEMEIDLDVLCPTRTERRPYGEMS